MLIIIFFFTNFVQNSGKHRGLGVHLSFVRSISMDKWKDAELEKMKVGGNRWVLILEEWN